MITDFTIWPRNESQPFKVFLMVFMHTYAFTYIFSLRILLVYIRRLFDRKPDKLLPQALYRIRVAGYVMLKVCEEDAMNDVLFAPLSIYREGASKLTCISN